MPSAKAKYAHVTGTTSNISVQRIRGSIRSPTLLMANHVYRIPFNIQPSLAEFSIPAFDVILQSQIIANCGTGTWTAYRISLCPNVSILHINCLYEKNCSAFNDGFDFKLSIFYRIVTHH